VRIEQPVTQQNKDTGATTKTWQAVATVWAKIEPLSVREFVAAGTYQSKVTTRIVIRYRSGLKATMRMVHGAKIYNIEGILADPSSGREYLTIAASEGVNNG